jgi:hypothetical protein
MKNLTAYFLTFLILLVLFSCGRQTENTANQEKEIPAALQEKKALSNYKNIRSDLTEELYSELVSKTPELKKFEDDLMALSAKPEDLAEKFTTYNSKSDGYYYSAENKSGTIKDSMLKKRILDLISVKRENYLNKTAELNALLAQIKTNSTTLADYHTVLKILLTLPVMEKYQNENIPGKSEFKDLVKQQENAIKQTDKLTPKY